MWGKKFSAMEVIKGWLCSYYSVSIVAVLDQCCVNVWAVGVFGFAFK